MWKVLVVEDNKENRELMVEILRDVAQCSEADSGQSALKVYDGSLRGDPFDVILLDIEMPDVDGLELLRTIREKEKEAGIDLGDGIPIIMVTAHKKPFLDAFYQGCTDYILKPIDPRKLIDKVREKSEKEDRF